jgi:hypothetical protein
MHEDPTGNWVAFYEVEGPDRTTLLERITVLEQELREKGDLAVERRGECIQAEAENKRLRTLVEQVWQECNDYYDLDADLEKYGIEAFTTPALRGLYDIRRALADEEEK